MKKIRAFNWAGSKYKYIDLINSLIQNKKFDRIIDGFMGSGNVLLNLEVEAKEYIGIDLIKLLPNLYQYLKNNPTQITTNDLQIIIEKNNNFFPSTHYYEFREKWNEDYLANNYSKDFIIKTVLLLKMCSNSMVRFNNKTGKFNQGYRGCSEKGFFKYNTLENITEKINNLIERLSTKNYQFYSDDFFNYIDNINLTPNDLLILDPPYLLESSLYSIEYNQNQDQKLKELLLKTQGKFIYFNYLQKFQKVNENAKFLADQFYTHSIRSNTSSGQFRKGTSEVDEVLITNLVNN